MTLSTPKTSRRNIAPREDAYAEYRNWADTGCDIHPACLSCPLPKCRYEYRGTGGTTAKSELKASIVMGYQVSGLGTAEIAARVGISVRQTQRILAAQRAVAR